LRLPTLKIAMMPGAEGAAWNYGRASYHEKDARQQDGKKGKRD
jgi:hypothetical protein